MCLARTCYTKELRQFIKQNDTSNSEKYGIERLLANQTFTAAYPLHGELDKKLIKNNNYHQINLRQVNYVLNFLKFYF